MSAAQVDFSAYLPEHAERLASIASGPDWQTILTDEARLTALRESMLQAPGMPDPSGLLDQALLACN